MSISNKLLLFVASFWIIGIIICGLISGAVLSADQAAAISNDVTNPSNLYNPSFYITVGSVLWWDYPIFENDNGTANNWMFLKIIFLMSTTAVVALTVGFQLLIAGISALGNIFRWFKW